MLKEISKDQAIAEFRKGKEIHLYHTKLKRMFTSTELIEYFRFLIDEEIPEDTKSEESDTSHDQSVESNIELKNEDDTKSYVKEIPAEEATSNSVKEDNTQELSDDSDLGEIKHTPTNDVKTEVIDGGEDEQIDYNDLIPGKKGRKITIDLGKLYSLRRARWTIKDIAYELNCSVATVNKYVNNKELEQKVLDMQSSK